jgi:hypothetical protein
MIEDYKVIFTHFIKIFVSIKTSYLPQLTTPVLCCWKKKPKPSQKFGRRHHSLSVVLFRLFMNGVASQDEEKFLTSIGKTIYQLITRHLRLDLTSACSRVGAFVEGASSAGTKRVTPERA